MSHKYHSDILTGYTPDRGHHKGGVGENYHKYLLFHYHCSFNAIRHIENSNK